MQSISKFNLGAKFALQKVRLNWIKMKKNMNFFFKLNQFHLSKWNSLV